MENPVDKNMEHEMGTLGPFKGVYRDNGRVIEAPG